jgi:multimeric flavodoxin WrbA
MNVLALIGSPRRRGNTDLLVDEILNGCRAKGHTAEKFFLYDYTLSLCVDCRNCKKGDYTCCINDDMHRFYRLMEKADVIVFGTPLYWYGCTAKMKMFIDRMRPFVESKKLNGKRAVLVVPSAEGPAACGPLVEMFRSSFKYLGMKLAGEVLAEAYEKGDIQNNKKELNRAYRLGASL